MENVFIIALILIIVIISIDNRIKVKKKYNNLKNSGNINEESYQKYAKFYEHSIPADILFEKKMNIIYQAIVVEKKKDIKKINKLSDFDKVTLLKKYASYIFS